MEQWLARSDEWHTASSFNGTQHFVYWHVSRVQSCTEILNTLLLQNYKISFGWLSDVEH
jgi:hypothetical protein